MSHEPSDALVFFGATGDLAHKKIFPALQALARRGHLDIPVVGVAKSGWTLDQLKARARDGVERYGWRIVEPILGDGIPTHEYEPRTWGPPQANALIASAGAWFDPPPR